MVSGRHRLSLFLQSPISDFHCFCNYDAYAYALLSTLGSGFGRLMISTLGVASISTFKVHALIFVRMQYSFVFTCLSILLFKVLVERGSEVGLYMSRVRLLEMEICRRMDAANTVMEDKSYVASLAPALLLIVNVDIIVLLAKLWLLWFYHAKVTSLKFLSHLFTGSETTSVWLEAEAFGCPNFREENLQASILVIENCLTLLAAGENFFI
ncbi:hypothetical protein FEM48_Zijuj04G0147200 [Ziziphus jujuba var. spinosa]|uniref:Uncharacterized protein n=1 Tax=Ziziphus jujuba var. spinosa TaxID=714518 RepID=A0A978VKG9_ZIZJJ|nr:hypothetical protein FEM48_Zijuj04G0147200 [Ziziphus jujuba var. spinosa]